MRRSAPLILATLLALAGVLACDAGLTAPPHGLVAALARVNAPAPPTQFMANGDSVTVLLASSLLTNNPCAASQLDAGLSGATLVITSTSRVPMSACPALLAIVLPTTRIVVRGVPRGSYDVILAERVTLGQQRATESVIARGHVEVP
jgi:hypothetical protein